MIDVVALIALSGLMYTDKVKPEYGIALFVAIVAGRLRPALGSGTLALLAPLGAAFERFAHRG